jgi:hypothetical protein
MGVEKMSVSFDLGLGQAIRQSAQHSAQSVSSWLAEAAADRLRREALGDAVVEWEETFGELSEAEITAADRVLDRASRRRRTGAA